MSKLSSAALLEALSAGTSVLSAVPTRRRRCITAPALYNSQFAQDRKKAPSAKERGRRGGADGA